MGWMQDIRIVQSVPANNWLWMNLAKVVAVINHLGDCVAVDPSLFTKCHHLFLPALKLFVFHMLRCSSERVQCRKVTDQRSLHSSGLHCDISSVCQKSVFAEIEIRSHIGTGRQRTERSSLLLWISEIIALLTFRQRRKEFASELKGALNPRHESRLTTFRPKRKPCQSPGERQYGSKWRQWMGPFTG